MFYEFRQNNTGGSFDFDEATGISVTVIVEADSPREANDRAESIGLYFHGYGDCNCCGNRWYRLWDQEKGSEVPSIYNTPIEEHEERWKWAPDGFPEAFVHHADGTITGHVLHASVVE